MNQSFKDLTVYKKAFSLAMEIFEISKTFPKEEKYSFTDQIRRSSRSVCSGIAEAYRKRNYPGYFVSKSSDADMENGETQVWLHFASAVITLINLSMMSYSKDPKRLASCSITWLKIRRNM